MLRILLLAFALGASAAPSYSGTANDVSDYQTDRKCKECVKAEEDLISAIQAHDDASGDLKDATDVRLAPAQPNPLSLHPHPPLPTLPTPTPPPPPTPDSPPPPRRLGARPRPPRRMS